MFQKRKKKKKRKEKKFASRRSIDAIKSAWVQNLWQLFYQLDPETKKLAKNLEKKNNIRW